METVKSTPTVKTVKRKSKVKSSSTAKATDKTPKTEAVADNTQKNVEAKSIARDTKYLYPEGSTSKLDRKKFRTSARNTWRSFEKRIAKAETVKDKKALGMEFNNFKKETFVDGLKATIGN